MWRLWIVILAIVGLDRVLCEEEERVHARLANGSPIVGKKVSYGKEARKVEAYLGIPYGKPPTGDLRFAPPIPVDPWTQKKETVGFGNSCWQSDDTTYGDFRGSAMWNANTDKSEDCLFLNVWTKNKQAKMPVMIWIYGGSYNSGTSSLAVYDGRIMAEMGDVVIVSLNYRLGPFGFLVQLDDTVADNAGLLDQRLAMKWVKDNIAKFGGDPDQVTIFGESAGGASVGHHLISPESWPYFQRAIMQSGSMMSPWGSVTRKEALRRTSEMARDLACPTGTSTSTDRKTLLDCLRNKVSAVQLKDAQWIKSLEGIFEFAFVPVIGSNDKATLPGNPRDLVRRGAFKECDIIFGWNANEGSWFAVYMLEGFDKEHNSLISEDSYVKNLAKSGLELDKIGLNAVAFEYSPWQNPQDTAGYRDAIDQIIGDKHIVCPGIEMLQTFAAKPQLKVYAYLLDSIISSNPWPEWMGVMHGYEIEYVFGIPLWEIGDTTFPQEEKVLSERMLRYWTNFAKTGSPQGNAQSPNPQTLPNWPSFDSHYNSYVVFDEVANKGSLQTRILPWTKQCAFWNRYLPELAQNTAPITDAELKWKTDLSRWNDAMDRWDKAFDKFERGSKRSRH